MSYDINKQEVLKLFDYHIMKYIIKDLEVLDSIISDNAGTGGCAIPQAISTFSALDLIGYLVHPQEIKPVGMSFSELLKNEIYFPGFKEYTCHINFLDSFRDNIRSIMVHRYSLVGYEITKNDTEQLFWNNGNNQTFNASYFTKMVTT